MGRIRRGLQRVAQVVARRVAQDDLFEKRGERAVTTPLPPRAAGAAPAPQAASAEAASQEPSASADDDGGPAGCRRADLAALRGALGPTGRVRVVNHWATWCDPCIEELPHLVALARELGPRAEVLGVSWDLFDPRGAPSQVARDVARFAQAHGLTWSSLLVDVEPPDFFAAFDITWEKIPQTWVIDGDGKVVERFEGVVDAALCARIQTLVEERTA